MDKNFVDTFELFVQQSGCDVELQEFEMIVFLTPAFFTAVSDGYFSKKQKEIFLGCILGFLDELEEGSVEEDLSLKKVEKDYFTIFSFIKSNRDEWLGRILVLLQNIVADDENLKKIILDTCEKIAEVNGKNNSEDAMIRAMKKFLDW